MDLYSSNEYRATKDWPYAVSSGCVVFRHAEGGVQVLVLPRDSAKNNWGRDGGLQVSYHLPKGHVGLDETLQEAAKRETEEEAGVELVVKAYLGTREDVFTHPNTKIDTIKTVHYFAAEWQGNLPTKDNEHDAPVWVSVDEAVRLLGPPMPKHEDEIIERLKKYLELHNASDA